MQKESKKGTIPKEGRPGIKVHRSGPLTKKNMGEVRQRRADVEKT